MKSSVQSFFLISFVFFAPLIGWAQAGYLSSVQEERQQTFVEVYLAPPKIYQGPRLEQRIFSPLSKEFQTKYSETFGAIDAGSLSFQTSQGLFLEDLRLVDTELEEETRRRRAFAEYMMKRLIEYHVDNYFKTEPTMRPVYEAKEKISNVQVQVSKEVRMNIRYDFSGNTLDFNVKNPWVDSKISLQMDPSTFGPSNVIDRKFWLGKNLDAQTRLQFNYADFTDTSTLERIDSFRSWQTIVSVVRNTALADGIISDPWRTDFKALYTF
jgi:hypothetical protein